MSEEEKFYVVDYTYDNGQSVGTEYFKYDDEMEEARIFCEGVNQKNGLVNIKIGPKREGDK